MPEPLKNQPLQRTYYIKLRNFLSFIRFSHTIFALPFALGAMLVAARGFPGKATFFLILLAMVFARTAAMLFNRLVDWDIDKRNPRTKERHQLINQKAAWLLCFLFSIAFLFTSFKINLLCGLLSPLALALIFFYSLCKRFTSLSPFVLGLSLAAAPIGAWIAVQGAFSLPPFILATAVLLWVAGFDTIYASLDKEFDEKEKLHSLITKLGTQKAFSLVLLLHLITLCLLVLFGVLTDLSLPYHIAIILCLPFFIYEYLSAKSQKPSTVTKTFFHANAYVSSLFLIGVSLRFLL